MKHLFTFVCMHSSISFISDKKTAFSIYWTPITYSTTRKVLKFSSTKLNIGGKYNTTSGIFTCEHGGMYVFVLNIYRRYASGNSVGCHIIKNGITDLAYANAPEYSEGNYNGGSGSAVVHLDPGETVAVGDCIGNDNVSNVSSFMGFLLQAD